MMSARPAAVSWLWGGLLTALGILYLLNRPALSVGESFALLILTGSAIGFAAVYGANRSRWWALIPAYIFLGSGGVLVLAAQGVSPAQVAGLSLLGAALPLFLLYWLSSQHRRALFPAYILGVVGGLLLMPRVPGHMVGAYVLFAAAALLLYAHQNRPGYGWALAPGLIMALIGLALLLSHLTILIALAMIGGGLILLRRQAVQRREQARLPIRPAPRPQVTPPRVTFEPIGARGRRPLNIPAAFNAPPSEHQGETHDVISNIPLE